MYYHYKLKLNKKEEKIIGRYFKFFPRVLLGPGDDKVTSHTGLGVYLLPHAISYVFLSKI